ncbi:hypothetical protein CCP3SC1_190027 [Gammaproteobacteria bacterium]
MEELRKHLQGFGRFGLITSWYDRSINADAAWDDEIRKNLEQANLHQHRFREFRIHPQSGTEFGRLCHLQEL